MPKSYTGFFKGEGIDEYDDNGFADTNNLDTTSSLGTVQAQFELESIGATIDEPCYQAKDTSGNVYFFSSTSGKIWKRTTANAVTLEHTNTLGAHINARFFNGKIYYCVAGTLGEYNIVGNMFTDSFATFNNGSSYHPMEEVNATLYVGDGKDILSVNAGNSVNPSALDLPADYVCTALLNDDSYLLVGSTVSSTTVTARVFYWDGFSSSWTIEDDIQSVNYFVKVDNFTLIQAGSAGSIYSWDGNKGNKWRLLRNSTSGISMQAVASLADKTLIAVDDSVYSIYQKTQGTPLAIVHEYTAPSAIISICVSGTELLVSIATGVLTLGTDRATGSIVTPILRGGFYGVEVPYETLGGGTIGLETNVNGNGFVSETNFVDDSTNRKYLLVNGISSAEKVLYGQVRVTINPSGANSPKIQEIKLITGE